MNPLEPLAWTVGATLFVLFSIWMAVLAIRWAKRRNRSTELLGWSMGLPAAGINPQPPPQEQIEEMTHEIQGRKNADSSDPKE